MKSISGTTALILLLPLLLTGCGDFFGKKVVKNPIQPSYTKIECELDMDAVSHILEENIAPSLNCLEKTLNVFIQVSELGDGQRLPRTSLINFLKRNRPDVKPSTYKVINTVFSLSHLITGESPDFISKENVKNMLDLARLFNYHAYNYYNNTFNSEEPANLATHKIHRERIEGAASELKLAIEKLYNPNGKPRSIDIMALIESFVKDGDDEALEKIKGLLFAKKIITGGEPETLTHTEMGFLINNIPKLLSLLLDGVRYKYLEMEQKDMLEFLKNDVINVSNILFHPSHGDRKDESLFHVQQAVEGVDRLIKKEDKKLFKYLALIKEGVLILTGKKNSGTLGKDELWVTGGDLEKMLGHVYNVTARGLVFHRLFASPQLAPLLARPQSISLDPKDFAADFPTDAADLKEFCRIVNNYRFQRGSFDMASYSLEYKRNPAAVTEISIFEYFIRRAFDFYSTGGLSIDPNQLKAILKKFEKELVEVGIILPRRSYNTAETISLLGSLFQYQSDDNGVLDVSEAAEFGVSLMTAMDAKNKLNDFYLEKKCTMDQFYRMEPNCFKEHFYEGLCLNYRSSLPRLFEYMGVKTDQDCKQNFNSAKNMLYLETSIKAARFCHTYTDDNEEIFYSKGDMMSIVLAMMHIETTIIRWDKNLNNIMDKDEVNDAYAIYKTAIEGMTKEQLGKLPPKIREPLTKLIYQYLVKFEEAPKLEGKDILKTIGNLGKLLIKKSPADRKTIASILKAVSDESKKKALAAGIPPFDCNWLHDPDNIPQD